MMTLLLTMTGEASRPQSPKAKPSSGTIVVEESPSVDTNPSVQKARKNIEKGFEALKAGNLQEATRHITAAYKIAPHNSDTNYLMGSLLYAQKQSREARNYFLKSLSIDGAHIPSLLALGQMLLQQEDFKHGIPLLQRVVSLDRKQWQAHCLLAHAYFAQHDFEDARHEGEEATRWGNSAAFTAELISGLSSIEMGRFDDALTTLQRFLRNDPAPLVARQIHAIVDCLLEAADRGTTTTTTNVERVEQSLAQLLETPEFGLLLPSLVPPSLDDESPIVNATTSCPVDDIVDRTSNSVLEFVKNLDSFAATETLLHQRLNRAGQPLLEETRRYSYLASVKVGTPAFDEYRNGTLDTQFTAGIAATGILGIQTVFHPYFRDSYRFTCEGLGEWRGQSAWVIDFYQRDDRPSRFEVFRIGNRAGVVDIKGRAWVSTNDFNVLRIETDIVRPIPQLSLLAEREFVEYHPVQFRAAGVQLWLPSQVVVYLELHGAKYRRVHTFSDYKLFSVKTTQIIDLPKVESEILP